MQGADYRGPEDTCIMVGTVSTRAQRVRMRRIFGSVLLLYALLICFGDAFKPHPWVPIPLGVLLLGVVLAAWSALLAPRIRLDHGFFRSFDLLLLAYVIDLGLSLLVSGRIESKNVHHL